MSFIGGYQSDTNLNDINYVGDFPIEHSLGGFGIATGVNDYLLDLTPNITDYREGLPLEVRFSQPNTANSTINVDGHGVKVIKKIASGALVNLEAGDLTSDKIYLLIYDGTFFQIANSSHLLKDATEARKGISQIATTQEVNDGLDNTKIVTPAKLVAYVAGKITGLWEDKGTVNCNASPNYPPGQKGDAYTVSTAGKIGGAAGVNVQLRDVIYCSADNPGGTQAAVGSNWNVIQANLEQATELIAGFARIATLAEATSGANDSLIITPLKLSSLLKYQAGTGANSIIPKLGANNLASNPYAAVLNGNNNRANGSYSSALGTYADALTYNEWAKAGGAFYNTRGSAQNSILNLFNIIPSGGGLFPLTPDGAGAGTLNRWLPPTNCVQQFMAQFTVTHNSGIVGTPGETRTGIYEGALKNVSGTVSFLGGAPTLRELRQDAGFSPTVGFVVGGNEIVPFVVGMANRSLHAHVTVYITQTKFNLS